MGCRFIGGAAGAPGKCTQFAGILSNREIRQMIKDDGITPYLNSTAMVKYFKYAGDSWVGYDDADTFAMKEAYANNRCLVRRYNDLVCRFDDETGVGLGAANGFKSPESATVIPMAHTTVPRGQTFTINAAAATDVPRLSNDGMQNVPAGPGDDQCQQCSFFRLITSTCCGTGGTVGNPITIQPNVPTPMDIPLPAGFTPNQSFRDTSGTVVPANQPLPRETIIPRGTTFTQPFKIPSGMPLRQGESDDQSTNSSLIWLSPEIWDNQNPEVQCLFPCTFVLPPWPSYTTTIDYPRITVTRSGTIQTTLTFPPITVSEWEPSTIVVSASSRCITESCTGDDLRRTSSASIRSTTTWPPVTWTDSGTIRTTYPPTATRTGGGTDPTGGGSGGGNPPCLFPLFCPPGPPPIRLPPLTINWGPPKPVTTPCAYSAQICPPPGTTPPRPGGLVVPPGLPPQEPSEVDPTDICPLLPSTTRIKTMTAVVTTTSTSTTWTEQPTPTPVAPQRPHTFNTPDWSKDETKCYDSGMRALRVHLINPTDTFCGGYKDQSLSSSWFSGVKTTSFPCCEKNHEIVPLSVEMSIEVHMGCQWDFDVNDCKAAFRKIIDGCDTNGRDDKQGGRLVGNCITFRVDPNNGS
ncbi:hypothetical protein FB567DRAFT_557562 [Paraphoma chrysanthemicola]|uniref:Uncharacterized protein n=1 Tax=Paraphoma chrysanthemicola TaxID=798071 RepID=A0A8K0W1X4_9PLEO|nr:hypothetical protein FB567DRAFT_557562 [Paraphoma chrysanthemicola]